MHRSSRRPQVRCVFRRNHGSLTIDGPLSETSRWRAVARVLRSPMDALGCALLPASCTLCGSPLPHLSSVPVCDACLGEFPVRSGHACVRCGDSIDAPLVSAPEKNLCRACRLAPPAFLRAVAYGPYEGRMRDAIHVLKYSRMHAAARILGPMLAAAVDRLATEAPAEMLVVPVPLYRSKRAARGFNQARLLAIHAIQALRKTNPRWCLTLAPHALMRVRATQSQAGLTTRQRRQNLRGAFRVSDISAVAGRHILVIDDIFTTGATARAAARALVNAGAAGVWVATLARAGRLYSNSRNSSADLDLALMRRGTPGSTLAGNSQIASMHSYTDQPSF
jgi:ComF family protein